MTRTPWIKHVPKDPAENLRWRLKLRQAALDDKHVRHVLYDAAMDDVLFWMNAFCWCVEPRAEVKIRPFVTWPHQDPVFVAMDKAIDDSLREGLSLDVLLEKSRAQGGTYGYLWIDLRRWLRDPMFSAGYVTRNEDLVDSATDADTLFWKLAWAIDKLPFWMKPKGFVMKQHRSLSDHTIINPENGATLAGYAAGQDVGRGGRKTVFTCDEIGAKDFIKAGKDAAVMESLHDVTNCAAAGTLVVTDRGLVPIESVELFHRVWDGTMWVSHDGRVYQGEQETISAYGIVVTPDHSVLTTKGWEHASVEGLDREEIRLPNGYQEEWIDGFRKAAVAVPVQVRKTEARIRKSFAAGPNQKLRMSSRHSARQIPNARVHRVDGNEAAMRKPKPRFVSPLRWTRDFRLQAMAKLRELHGGHGGEAARLDSGQNRQLQGVRAGKLQVEYAIGTVQQQEEQSRRQDFSRDAYGISNCQDDGPFVENDHGQNQEGLDWRQVVPPSPARREAVYDLLNCGPRQAFTVIDRTGRPLLVHNCIRQVSTFGADAGVFYEACQDPDGNGVHLVLDWKDNPEHAKHSYIVRASVPVAMKPEDQPSVNEYHRGNPDLLKKLERKGHVVEGKVRSPWYDMRCLRKGATPRLIARELDRNPRGAVGKVFETDLLDRMKAKCCKEPVWQGVPVFDYETLTLKGLLTQKDGPLKLWFRPGADNSPPLGPFTVGCDIAIGSSGQYASNSVAHGIDDRTGEQVLEYTVKGVPSIKFGRAVVVLCRWLRGAYLGWEDSGMAGPFAKEILEVICYGKVYYRPVPEVGSHRKGRKAGWWNGSDDDKGDLFEKLALAMESGEYQPRSVDMIRECGEYEWEKGKIIHRPTKNHGETEKAHGDRCIAAGVAFLLYSEGVTTSEGEQPVRDAAPPYGSWAWREQREKANRFNSDSPEFGIRDLLGV